MAAFEVTKFNNLQMNMDDVVVRARILRLWRQPDNHEYSLHMVLMDENGFKAQGKISNRLVRLFQCEIREQVSLVIQNVRVGFDSSIIKYVDSPYKIIFKSITQLLRCDNWIGDKYGISSSPFQSLISGEAFANVSIDIIGHVKEFINADDTNHTNLNKKKGLLLELQDLEGYTIFVKLWDTLSDQIARYVEVHNNSDPLILILQFALLHHYNGSPYVSNSPKVSKLFINEDIDAINNYRISLLQRPILFPLSEIRPSGLPVFSNIENEFLVNNCYCNIGDIWEIDMEKSIIIVGTVIAVRKDRGWHYMACPDCNSKVSLYFINSVKKDGSGDYEVRDAYDCINENCKQKDVIPDPRFKIHLRVQDATGDVELILFHNEATEFIPVSANTLIEENTQVDDTVKFPDELFYLRDRVFAFKISITNFNLKSFDEVYGITKLTDDRFIISEITRKFQSSFEDTVNNIPKENLTDEECSIISGKDVKTKRKLTAVYEMVGKYTVSAVKNDDEATEA